LRPKSGSEEEKDHVQFVLAASWADAVERDQRATIYHHANWHYMRLFWSQSAPSEAAMTRNDLLPDGGELVGHTEGIESNLRENYRSCNPYTANRGTDLAWFLHMMGDFAQPLNCSDRITPQDPNGDKGGELFCLSMTEPQMGSALIIASLLGPCV